MTRVTVSSGAVALPQLQKKIMAAAGRAAAEGKPVLLAEARLGELFNQLPKQQGARTDLQHLPAAGKKLDEVPAADDEKPRPKLEVAARMGFNKNQVADFQRLADNPDAVQKAIVTAEERASTALADTQLIPHLQCKN